MQGWGSRCEWHLLYLSLMTSNSGSMGLLTCVNKHIRAKPNTHFPWVRFTRKNGRSVLQFAFLIESNQKAKHKSVPSALLRYIHVYYIGRNAMDGHLRLIFLRHGLAPWQLGETDPLYHHLPPAREVPSNLRDRRDVNGLSDGMRWHACWLLGSLPRAHCLSRKIGISTTCDDLKSIISFITPTHLNHTRDTDHGGKRKKDDFSEIFRDISQPHIHERLFPRPEI